jgi:streptomycin 6-kinase
MYDKNFTDLPAKFTQVISEAHGAKGIRWLAELPEIIRAIEQDWNLKVENPFPNLSYHFVAPCRFASSGEAVVKIGLPETDSPIFNEAEILKIYGGKGAVKFLRIDEKRFALLIEKLTPGKHLKGVFENDELKAVETAVEVLQKIIRKTPLRHNFVLLEKWFAGLEKAKNTAFPAQFLEKACGFYDELKTDQKFLLHGDFHHENILSAGREAFLVIDPKGIIGDIGYEISVFLNNHVWWLSSEPDLVVKINDAISIFAEAFQISAMELKKWAFAQAVLSAWWTFEDNGENWRDDLKLADIWDV